MDVFYGPLVKPELTASQTQTQTPDQTVEQGHKLRSLRNFVVTPNLEK